MTPTAARSSSFPSTARPWTGICKRFPMPLDPLRSPRSGNYPRCASNLGMKPRAVALQLMTLEYGERSPLRAGGTCPARFAGDHPHQPAVFGPTQPDRDSHVWRLGPALGRTGLGVRIWMLGFHHLLSSACRSHLRPALSIGRRPQPEFQVCLKLVILSPRGTRGERTGERGSQSSHTSSPRPSTFGEEREVFCGAFARVFAALKPLG